MFGGAWQIGLPGAVPWLVLPVHLMFASIGVRCLLLSAAVMLPSLLWWHRRMLRMRRRSNFLFSWVLYFLKPDDVPALHAFVRQDLVSMQHIALSILLFAAGSGEVTFAWMVARAGLEKCRNYRWMHQVWFANMALGGCLFLAHPQKTIELAIQHSVIGTALVFGAHFLACEKLRNFEGCLQWKFPSRLEVPGDLAMATVAFAIAAGTMAVIFTLKRFRPGWPGILLAVVLLIIALASPVLKRART